MRNKALASARHAAQGLLQGGEGKRSKKVKHK
jgi:hypothetical protein